MNDGPKAIEQLHRLFCVSVMLRNAKTNNRGKAHNYPQLILSYLLILAYQRKHNLYPYQMLIRNQTIYNEDLGEITFSVLSRCVLGDNNKSNFDHLNQMYTLLPYVKQVVNSISDDTGVPNTLNWRKTIPISGTEVTHTGDYFKKLIQLVVAGQFRSYDGSEAGYGSLVKSREHMVPSTSNLVYMTDITNDVEILLASVKKSTTLFYMYEFRSVWPEANQQPGDLSDAENSDSAPQGESDMSAQPDEGDLDMQEFDGQSDSSLSSINNVSMDPQLRNDGYGDADDAPEYEQSDDESDSVQFVNAPDNSHLNRSWESWGTVHNENVLNVRPHARHNRGRPPERHEPGWDDLLNQIDKSERKNRQ